MFAVGDRVRVICPRHIHINCEGSISESEIRNNDRLFVKVDIDVFPTNIHMAYRKPHSYWFYGSFLEKIDNTSLPSGVYRCRCGSTTTSPSKICCDCKAPKEDCPY